jgi:hypothetical protein
MRAQLGRMGICTDREKEMITKAAIRFRGKIIKGFKKQRHCDIITHIFRTCTGPFPDIDELQDQGFIDDNGKFYSRLDAAQHALECGQITTDPGPLRSEDLW